jgi:hypothetical protein
MKLNQLLLLSTASLLISTLPFTSYAAQHSTNSSQLNNSQTLIAQSSSVAMSGNFTAAEKPTTGMARIVSEGEHYYLELDDAFSTSDQGPDLHVLLDPAENPPQTYSDMNSPVNLGKLHSYPIPDAIDPANFKSVVIWCRMANATFGYAPLK